MSSTRPEDGESGEQIPLTAREIIDLGGYYVGRAEPFGQEVGPYGFTVVGASVEMPEQGIGATVYYGTARGKTKAHGAVDKRYATAEEAGPKLDEYLQDLAVMGPGNVVHSVSVTAVKRLELNGSAASVVISIGHQQKPYNSYSSVTIKFTRSFGADVHISQEVHGDLNLPTGEYSTRTHMHISQPATPERRSMLYVAGGRPHALAQVALGQPAMQLNRILTPDNWRDLLEDDLNAGHLITADPQTIQNLLEWLERR